MVTITHIGTPPRDPGLVPLYVRDRGEVGHAAELNRLVEAAADRAIREGTGIADGGTA